MATTKKSLGQHWLKNRQILDEIANLAGSGELCVEIGPGLGTLTSSLLKNFNKVISIELDDRLAENLPKSFPGKNLEVIHADFLDYNLESLPQKYVLTGNIPYYITSPIIMKALTARNRPSRIVLLIQKEVAERLAAPDNKKTYLSIFAQSFTKVSLGPVVPRDEFTPPPKVDSQIIILDPYSQPLLTEQELTFVKFCFTAPRKKLIKVLLPRYQKAQLLRVFSEQNINSDVRPANLSINDWKNLFLGLEINKH
jgi:16S rRNA (adenine1518-N6/adenine1519-N6)-dimethyltransferase